MYLSKIAYIAIIVFLKDVFDEPLAALEVLLVGGEVVAFLGEGARVAAGVLAGERGVGEA